MYIYSFICYDITVLILSILSLGVMGAHWSSLPEKTRHVILSNTAQRFSWFESQGVSNVIYGNERTPTCVSGYLPVCVYVLYVYVFHPGMALMQAKWDANTVELSDFYKIGSNTRPNVAYSSVLTVSNEYKEAACAAIADKMSIDRLIDGMLTPQAVSNIIYSLGKRQTLLISY